MRKSAGSLTANERQAFLDALVTLKTTYRDPAHVLTIYDELVAVHLAVTQLITGPQAEIDGGHNGPAFLPWHREYLLMLERELQKIDSSISVPYWDWSSNDANEAILIFRDDFMGPRGSTGLRGMEVQAGSFRTPTDIDPAPWRIIKALRPDYTGRGLLRNRDLVFNDLPYDTEVSQVLRLDAFHTFRPALETMHNGIHRWVGGSMADMTSPNDPIFFLHHVNVDRIWAAWQQNHSGAANYNSSSITRNGHKINDKMWPWDGGDSSPGKILNALLPTFDIAYARTPNDVLDIDTLGYSYDVYPQ